MNLPGINYVIMYVISTQIHALGSSFGGKEHKSLLLVGLNEHLIDAQPYPSRYRGAI